MSMFGQVIPFRARRERAEAPPKRVHRSLSAALAEAGLADAEPPKPPPLLELTVEPEAGIAADELFSGDELSSSPAEEVPSVFEPPPRPERRVQEAVIAFAPLTAPPAPASMPPPVISAAPPVPHWTPPQPSPPLVPQPPVAVEAPLPRVIALATRHPPTLASYPWAKSARRRRFKARLSDAASWLVTIAIVAGMIGVAATFLVPPGVITEPVAQQ